MTENEDTWRAQARSRDCPPRRHELRRVETPDPSAPVQVRQGGSDNFICAAGTAQDEDDPSIIATAVYGKVYTGALTSTNVPASPPSGSAQAQMIGFQWGFTGANELPGATCSPTDPTTAQNTLVIWYQWPDGSYTTEVVVFGGVCSPNTECGSMPEPPDEWDCQAKGFGGGAAPFGEHYRLRRVASPLKKSFLWSNGGDGAKAPRVDLSFDGAQGVWWYLTFRLGGRTVIYRLLAAKWTWKGGNTLSLAQAAGLALDDTVPGAVRVQPA